MVQLWDKLLVKDGILCRLFENVAGTNVVAQLIVPDSLKKEILHGDHEDVGGGYFAWSGENGCKVERKTLLAGEL